MTEREAEKKVDEFYGHAEQISEQIKRLFDSWCADRGKGDAIELLVVFYATITAPPARMSGNPELFMDALREEVDEILDSSDEEGGRSREIVGGLIN